ncbi:MAG: AraC family transcriptional regulator [Lachnospiraceae bacterium]|nr:AraC family transcriptional regulator [Lachnospiraceae bacterium]
MGKNLNARLEMLREMVSCCFDISFWEYDSQMQLLNTTCDDAAEIHFFFQYEKDRLMKALRNNVRLLPMVLINSLEMMWIIGFERDEKGGFHRAFVTGPVFIENITESKIESALVKMKLSPASRQMFYSLLQKLPVLPFSRFAEYGIVLQFCASGEKIHISDLVHVTNERGLLAFDSDQNRNRHSSWAQEQQLLKLMEEGNLDYKRFASSLTNVGFFTDSTSVRQIKDAIIIHVALCTRAAIRGGLDPEIAYMLSDNYINDIEASSGLDDITLINSTMQDDFVRRVHQCRSGKGISPIIQKCCSYIQTNLSRKMTSAELANWVGYSESYLTSRFKAEMGMTIGEYIMDCRIDRAKFLLRSGNEPIQDICGVLGFGSQSYFGEKFKKATGMTPLEYRNKGHGNKE